MAVFRPGKPWWKLGFSADAVKAGGASDIIWEILIGGDGAFTWPGGSSTTVQVDVAGLYLLGAAVCRRPAAFPEVTSHELRVNGALEQFDRDRPADVGTSITHTKTLIQLVPGDLLTVNAALATLPSTIRFDLTEFWGVRIGPVRWT